jgi:hypothetical protein
MRRITKIGLVLALFFASNCAVFYVAKKQVPIHAYGREMASVIDAMLHISGPFVLIIGDSIAERAKLPDQVCGSPLINAGIGSARVSFFIPFAEEMRASKITPTLIVVALGMNNSNEAYNSNFGANYNLLLDSLPKSTLALATVTRAQYQDTKQVSQSIREIAAARHLDIIELDHDYQTVDGTHLNEAGYTSWNERILSGVEQLMPNCHLPRVSSQP